MGWGGWLGDEDEELSLAWPLLHCVEVGLWVASLIVLEEDIAWNRASCNRDMVVNNISPAIPKSSRTILCHSGQN